MTHPAHDGQEPGGNELCSFEQLLELSGLALDELEDLIHCGLLAQAAAPAPVRSFHVSYVATLTAARRLRDDFQLDRHGLTLALTLLARIGVLEQSLSALHARLGDDER